MKQWNMLVGHRFWDPNWLRGGGGCTPTCLHLQSKLGNRGIDNHIVKAFDDKYQMHKLEGPFETIYHHTLSKWHHRSYVEG